MSNILTEDNAPLTVENPLLTLKNQVQKSKKCRDHHDEAITSKNPQGVGESATTSTLPEAMSKKISSINLKEFPMEDLGSSHRL